MYDEKNKLRCSKIEKAQKNCLFLLAKFGHLNIPLEHF